MWKLRQYRTVFNDFYSQCDESMRAAIDQRLERLQCFGNEAGEPTSKRLKGTSGIFECRPRAGKRQVRLLYFFQPQKRIVFVVCVEKSKFNRNTLAIAEKRKAAIESGHEVHYGTDYAH